eukprot:EG_transcript_19338
MSRHNLFGFIVAGRPEYLADEFRCEENRKWLINIPSPVNKPCQVAVWLTSEGLRAIDGTGKTVAVYGNIKGNDAWAYLGKIDQGNPSLIVQMAWQGPTQPPDGIQVGLAVESFEDIYQKTQTRMIDGSKEFASNSEGRTVIGVIPETAVGAFIGKGGNNIKQFEQDVGCRINLDSVTREVHTDCIHKAKVMLDAFLLRGGGGKGGGYRDAYRDRDHDRDRDFGRRREYD